VRLRHALLALCLVLPVAGAGAAVAPLVSPPVPAPSPVPGDPLFIVSGRGYGHGVGMSQFGAAGMASAGYSYDKILAYYYPGTTLGRAGRSTVRVLLEDGRKAVTVTSTVPFTALDAAGTVFRLPARPLVLRPDLSLPDPAGPIAATGPLLVRPGKGASLVLDGKPYRGSLQVLVQAGFLRVVNVVGLEQYVQGVVPGEMPQSWPAAALQAQAVAARSYALANLVKNKPFDLYDDQRSQVYLGAGGEKPQTSAAVTATAGQVVMYGGKVASTLYFSSSGGRTASSADVFGIAVPYLVSRPDPWDSASPYHVWGPLVFGARTVQAKLGLNARVLDMTGVPTPSGRLRSLVVSTAAGPTTIPSALLRAALGLRSTWVTIGVIRLDRPTAPVVFGSSVRVSGVARSVVSPVLLASPDGTTWASVGSLRPDATGAVSLVVRPAKTMRYRIQAQGTVSPTLLVPVAPRVRLSPPAEPQAQELLGTVRPKLVGADVRIEYLGAAGWTTVAQTVVDGSGAFQAAFALAPGSYRALVAPTNGFAQGITPVLEVSG